MWSLSRDPEQMFSGEITNQDVALDDRRVVGEF